jgi:peptide/nickel transport system substrate-binding protein
MKKQIGRREFLRISAVAAAGAAAACAPTPEVIEKIVKETVVVEKEVEKEVTKVVEVEKEVTKEVIKEVEKQVTVVVEKGAPEPDYLADKVSSGALPTVDERLPVSPAVVTGRESIGVYGGEARLIHMSPNSWVSNYGWFAERMLQYSDIDLRTIYPNQFDSWEVEESGKTLVLHLRQGQKWSDGEPVTTEDVLFWWDDLSLNEEISSGVWWVYRHGGDPMRVEALDDFSFRITFDAPFGNFPAYLTRRHQGHFLSPKHFLQEYHADYAEKAALDKMVSDRDYDTWVQLIGFMRGGRSIWGARDGTVEHPMLSGWVVTEITDTDTDLMERNPYYWKVDQMGNQLPYIDNIRNDLAASHEVVSMKIIQGELDYVGPHDVTIARYPLYKENEPDNSYIVADLLSCMTDRYTLYPQHNLPEDPVLEEIVNHPNFVKALSVAIDREEINQSLFFGLARMGQLGPMPMSKYYKEVYGTAWAQYDPDLANELLDEIGLTERDAEGYRLRSDGDRLRFNIEHAGARVGVSTHEFTEMVVTFWREVGIDATTKEIAGSLYNERMNQASVHCGIWHADRCTDLLLPIEMRWYIPTNEGQGGPGQLWGRWFRNNEAEGAVEPPAWIKETYDHYNAMNTTTDDNVRVAAGQKIFDVLAETPLSIGSILESPAPLIFNKNMGNLPRPKMPVGWDSYGISTYHPEAIFYAGGKRA